MSLTSDINHSEINRHSDVESLADRLAPEVLGSLNVGRYQLLVGAADGALLQPIAQPTTLVAKPAVPLQIPPAPRPCLGNAAFLHQAIAALEAGQSLEIVGPPGIGKSAFLRQLAHHPAVTTSHPDGILQVGKIAAIGDLIQSLGERFYHLYPESYLTLPEWQAALADCQALVMVNAPQATPEDLTQLCQTLPQSTFVLTSETPRSASLDLPQSIAVIQLPPLPLDAAQQLVESVLARSLSATEIPQFAALWQCFRGESTRMIQLAELQRESATVWDGWQVWLAAHPKPSLAQVNQHLVEGLVADLDTPQRWILGLLTALDGVSLSQSQIAAITGPQDPRSSLQRLVRLGLAQVVEQRYRVVDHLKPWLARQFDSQPWMARGLPVIELWLCAQSPEALLPELPVALAFLRWAVAEKRSQSVLAMARSLDAALILGKQWEQWGRVLQWALQAAWQLADDRAAAWAWHQLGTRALLLDDITTAYDALQQALKLRQAAGDPAAIALTRANRDQVIQSALPTPTQAVVRAESGRQSGGQSGRQSQPYAALLVIAIVTFMLALVAGLAIKSWVAPSPRSVPLSRQGQPPSAN
jgi:hypothetical protein